MNDEDFFKALEESGILRDEMSSLGWALWPFDKNGKQMGFFDERLLRRVADEIERRNKPFWDEYEAYCRGQMMRCKLNTDMWDDAGIEYIVHSYKRRPDSAAAELELEAPDGTMSTRVIAFHQIEWIDEDEGKDWSLPL